MNTANQTVGSAVMRAQRAFLVCASIALCGTAAAAGTPVGTVIENTATVDFELGGTPLTLSSNTTSITVVERIDVAVTLQSPS
ncbi:MAG: hypothetical protein KJO82_03210, partial [Gammaproteobacteria bacterium]|nr:hypothetical protein [Gammaproteobacteria bacterium]